MSRTITVKGTGNMSVRPDYVILSMSLEAKDKKYEKAMDIAATQLDKLNESLSSIGFKRESAKTTNFNVVTDYDSVRDEQGNYKRVFNGFVCRHQLKLSFDLDMKLLSKALGAVATSLAEPELSIAFTVKNPNEVNEELLRETILNAKKKAEILCDGSNVKLGKLLTIDYNWGELNIVSNTTYEIAESSMYSKSIEIEPDDIDVSDTATFVWEIE